MITGACLCGDVAYEIDGRISPIWLCHCSKCRRANGAAFHASAICRPSQFRWLSGSDKIAGYEDTKTYKVRFCERCGSPVPSHIEEFDFVSLPAGGLNGDPASKIAFSSDRDGNYEIYVMDADGSNPTNLTEHSSIDLFPAWSPPPVKTVPAISLKGLAALVLLLVGLTSMALLAHHHRPHA